MISSEIAEVANIHETTRNIQQKERKEKKERREKHLQQTMASFGFRNVLIENRPNCILLIFKTRFIHPVEQGSF